MPPPTVVCKVCGKSVMKSQTVCVGMDGGNPVRCCKSHPEAGKAAEWNREQEELRREKGRRQKVLDDGTADGTTKLCWCCLKPGVFTSEFWYMMLEESIKSQMEGRPFTEILDGTLAKRVKKRLEDIDRVVLERFLDLTPDQMTAIWRSKMPNRFKNLLPVVRGAILCLKCGEEFGLHYDPPTPTEEQLKASMLIMQLGGMEQKIADRIARDN